MTIKDIMQDDTSESVQIKISRILTECGIPAHLLGYEYLELAVMCVLRDPTYLRNMTKKLYPYIASFNNSSDSRVERAMRHAIQYAWRHHESLHSEISEKTFKHTLRGVLSNPTNSEFIAEIAKGIRQYRV